MIKYTEYEYNRLIECEFELHFELNNKIHWRQLCSEVFILRITNTVKFCLCMTYEDNDRKIRRFNLTLCQVYSIAFTNLVKIITFDI